MNFTMQYWLAFVCMLGLLSGCGNEVPDLPDFPSEVVLFSIHDRLAVLESDESSSNELLHGYPILGQVAIGDPAVRKEAVARVRQAIREGSTKPFSCFNPRHVLRVTQENVTTDVVICFECSRYQVYRNNHPESGTERTIAHAQPFFDKLLNDAGVPLARKPVVDDPDTPQ